ncbi:MAG: hypothetical protein RSC29_02380, partial [Oscillospiraceae bacterium]
SLYFGKYTTVNFEKIKEQNDLSEMYEIDYIEKKDDKTYIHLKDDSCLKKDGNTTSELVRPMRTFEGDLNFKIYTSFE